MTKKTVSKEKQKCPLCGFEFMMDEAQLACISCPFTKNCQIYCCPNCHYQFVHESKLVNLWKKIWTKGGKVV